MSCATLIKLIDIRLSIFIHDQYIILPMLYLNAYLLMHSHLLLVYFMCKFNYILLKAMKKMKDI